MGVSILSAAAMQVSYSMEKNRRKKDISDPCHYDLLINEQKSHVSQNPDDVKAWMELGCLYEARIAITNYFAKRNFIIRHFLPVYVLLIFSFILLLTIIGVTLPLLGWQRIGFISLLIIVAAILCLRLFSLRYPPSGRRYFRKAIALDPKCGEAYMYLGLIALRRYQKRKACRLLEQAIQLGVNSSRIKRELKSIYEREFVAFFRAKTNRETRQQEIIDRQLGQIRELRSRVSSLEGLIESLSGRVEKAKWQGRHKAKLLDKEMKDHISAIRQDYERQLATLKQAKESEEEARALAERDFVRLTTEVMEAKATFEGRSPAEAARTVEDIMGSHLWKALSEQVKSYLTTAEQIYTVLLTEGEERPDYSLVGMELCKALETEINRILVEPFCRYLNGNKGEFLKINQTGENRGRPSYFTYLAMVVDRKNFPEVTSLTLGQYHFVLKRTLEGEYALKEYSNFLDEVCSASNVTIGSSFLKKLETVTKKYRNTIAHQSAMNREEFDHMRKLIFGGEEALLNSMISTHKSS